MANNSLPHSCISSNIPLEFFDNLQERLSKAYALVNIASTSHVVISEARASTIHDYLWTILDLLDEAKTSLNNILEARNKQEKQEMEQS